MHRFQLLRYVNSKSFNYVAARCIMCSVSKCDKVCEDMVHRKLLGETMKVHPDFITPEEEHNLVNEVDPYLKRLQYESAHWDDAIHDYRETEWKQWNEQNLKIIDRIRQKAFPIGMSQLSLVHVLDLAADGWIKPHVDSVRFCGDIIAGLSLLSDSVMRLTMVDNINESKDFFLPRRSLYIMSGVARYDYNHEILKSEESFFKNQKLLKSRRISVICRSEVNRDKS